jgi:hypothetical protein
MFADIQVMRDSDGRLVIVCERSFDAGQVYSNITMKKCQCVGRTFDLLTTVGTEPNVLEESLNVQSTRKSIFFILAGPIVFQPSKFHFSVDIQCFKPPFSILLNFFNAYLVG